MEGKSTNIPFPQTNDLNKVIAILRVKDENMLSDNKALEGLLSVTQRQVNYYLAACAFLGLVDRKRKFTSLGIELNSKGYDLFILSLCSIIVSKPVFGVVFFNRLFNNEVMPIEEISQMIAIEYKIDNLEVANRRASTVKKWVDWIYGNAQKQ